MAGILLNFIEASLTSDVVSIWSITPGEKSIKDYREQYGECYHFHYFDNQILYWPKNVNIQDKLNGRLISISKQDHPGVYSKIIENSIADLFIGLSNSNGSKVYRFKKQQHTWEFTSNKNEAENQLEGLSIHRKVLIHPLYLKPKDRVVTGFTLTPSLKFRFTWNASDFTKKGIDIVPLLIDEDGTVIPNMQGVFHYLEATGNKNIYDKIVQSLDNNEASYQLLSKIIAWLNSKKADLKLPSGVSFKEFVIRYLPANNISASEIYSPTRYFYNSATNTKRISYYNDQVKEYKPFSYGSFEDKQINIGVLYPAEYEGRTELFLKTLEKSLKENLHLKNIKYIPFKIENTSLEAYKKGMYANHNAIKTTNLVLIILNQDHEKLPPNKSPYFVCKAKLIGEGVPTQDIQIETIQNRVHPLVISNISLNIYAKIGGTAWTIEKEEKLKDELVIGVGSTQTQKGQNILGIAQIFHPDGRYIVGNCSPLSTFENYAQNLETYLFDTLNEIIDAHINTSKTFRLIFHLYKSAGEDYELAAIEKVIKRLSNYSFDYALLHLGYGHNYRLYSDDGKGKLKKGTFIQVSPFMGLLHFVPDSILPLKIELDKRSKGFNDLFYLSKQIFWFSNLSHRSYNPSKRTVTIMYPSLMAAITEKLSLVDGWNSEMLEYVKDKQWFI